MRYPAPKLPDWLDRMVPFDRSIVPIGEHRIHVMEHGDPKGRPVVLLHGNPTWGFLYRKVMQALSREGLRLVVPDLVGLGYSSKPDASFHTIDAHAEVMRGLFDALGLEELVFVGQDWGGPIGLRALADTPARLAGLVVLNTVIGPPKPGFRPTPFHRFAALPVLPELVFRGLGFPQRFGLSRVQGDPASISGVVADAYYEPLRRLRDNAAPLALARMVPDGPDHRSIAPLERCAELIRGFEGPSAIVWGDRDPVLGSVRSHVERSLPKATVTRTDAGHFLQEEVPEAIAHAVRDVVSRIGARPSRNPPRSP